MDKLTNKCCGCGACATICPKDAIKIELNEFGFYSPKIDESKCINCGLCTKVCIDSIKDNAVQLNKKENYISAVNNKKILNKSSSGGIAYKIAEKYIEKEYAICGVYYNSKKEIAEHIVIKDKMDLAKIQGSKYIQSYTEDAFKEISKLEKGVIFGTPCQIAGMDAILKLKGKREQFILIDIFCHGVPSFLAFKNHLNDVKKSYKIKENAEVSFRDKKRYCLNVGNKYIKSYQYDPFYYLFLRGVVFQESCYTCPYRRNSYADIRLGDFTNEKYKSLNFSPSNIIINTNKGKEVLNEIKDELEIYYEDFEKVDKIQDVGDKEVPNKHNYYLERLKNGESPSSILKKEMLIMHIKGIVKKILRRQNNKETNYSLSEIIDKE